MCYAHNLFDRKTLVMYHDRTVNLCRKEENGLNCVTDIEVVFELNGTRKNPATDGYRPAHRI